MKNSVFDITFNKATGLMSKLVLCKDNAEMNWIAENGFFGKIHHNAKVYDNKQNPNMELISFDESETKAVSVFSNGFVEVGISSFFRSNNLIQEFRIKNISDTVLFLNEHNFSIETPFNDKYTSAEECMVHNCHTHIWCGGNSTYINALKMGMSVDNVGLAVTKGSFKSYSVLGCHTSNDRGRFLLNFEQTELLSGEESVTEWVIFHHSGKEDFIKKAVSLGNVIDIKAEHFTIFKGEKIKFTANCKEVPDKVRIYTENENISYVIRDDHVEVEFSPSKLGEYRIFIEINRIRTWADFIVKTDFETLLENRINYIVDKQQYNKPGSPLDGAFLIYDTKQMHPIFDDGFGDHNACRERIGMPLLICKYLQTRKNEKFYNALMKYMTFLKREFYDEKTGEVYNTINKNPEMKRLYNAPWVGTLFMEMYKLTGDEWYLDNILKIFTKFYSDGGSKFYPNAISFLEVSEVFKNAERMTDYEEITAMFKTHVDNLVKIGTSYPPHEVHYEQAIVTPATTLISEFVIISGDKKYVKEAKTHAEILERFGGCQPSFHLYEIPIRYWDDWWFGKLMTYGDTFPHYWSCISARAFNDYYKASNDEHYLGMAKECMRNCMCLFTDDGKGSAAYLYPFKADNTFGEAYDEWANDQDFALYFALETKLIK